ncbi:hypothetical protein SAMN00120144_1957 [Hymenobacter roseosalivarius DSM 11622]|uniref:DUF2029 domain-containing protein n=1 Tax=Hymenobacter roseosalivarius DSM 11622 TaxID=645990 RepID=A0A1W1W4A1_9BACT|nr:glycosyltransferase 87 family protein [Hymenobacter roseosalivarius]SMC00343.1 hypothetical protein SAMN00120144_1957 [Hymenobacter roseosalivarius DSM 11622]
MPRLTPYQLMALLLSAAAYAGIAYATPRAHFGQLVGLLAVAFAAYIWLVRSQLPLRVALVAGLLLRLLWLPVAPALSDDYHRFRWDGLLVAGGQNPYLHRPDELLTPSTRAWPTLADNASLRQRLTSLYPRLNSPHYYSVYPPVCQAVFGLGAWLFPDSEQVFIVFLRVVILSTELGTMLLLMSLLRTFGQPKHRALWYVLNPLVIVELTGNLHFEALLICGLLAAWWALARGRWVWSAGALGLAVATKLLPLLVLPFLIRRLGWGAFLRYAGVLSVVVGGFFVPFLSADLFHNFGRSLDLYFHTFEFNASFYYLLRAVGYWQVGYNQIATIGTSLALTAGLLLLLLAWREHQPSMASLGRALLLALTLYYLLATTIHPWYLTPLVALSCFARYRYALVWSGLVALSYAAYQTSTYSENLALVGLEYGIVLSVLLWELTRPVPAPLA